MTNFTSPDSNIWLRRRGPRPLACQAPVHQRPKGDPGPKPQSSRGLHILYPPVACVIPYELTYDISYVVADRSSIAACRDRLEAVRSTRSPLVLNAAAIYSRTTGSAPEDRHDQDPRR